MNNTNNSSSDLEYKTANSTNLSLITDDIDNNDVDNGDSYVEIINNNKLINLTCTSLTPLKSGNHFNRRDYNLGMRNMSTPIKDESNLNSNSNGSLDCSVSTSKNLSTNINKSENVISKATTKIIKPPQTPPEKPFNLNELFGSIGKTNNNIKNKQLQKPKTSIKCIRL